MSPTKTFIIIIHHYETKHIYKMNGNQIYGNYTYILLCQKVDWLVANNIHKKFIQFRLDIFVIFYNNSTDTNSNYNNLNN